MADRIIEHDSDSGVTTVSEFDESTGQMHKKLTQDVESVVKANLSDQSESSELGKGRYKHGKMPLVKAMTIPPVMVEYLRSIGYNLLSNDPEEIRRCTLYVQQNLSKLMNVPGKPFGKKKEAWI